MSFYLSNDIQVDGTFVKSTNSGALAWCLLVQMRTFLVRFSVCAANKTRLLFDERRCSAPFTILAH
ncbi:hypothetical protein CXF87_12650 [Halomonas sp. MES3-P3E]|nr:hypothetical protein CXF87_12650 [Halomonas sp. MES3-P3E]